ncbi:MAG: YqgE/AlgH family protein [Nitrospiraceae bacterium]|nr:YqgE/AlgH family protein [Nitrospiraceae bacterium]
MSDLSGKFLIAVPTLDDPNFRHTVILLCEHSREGAFGIILNRVLMNSFRPLLKAFDLTESMVDMPIHFGGPVRPEQGYVIYSPYDAKYGAVRVEGGLGVTTSKEILHDIAAGKGPKKYFFALGFAGWSSNQLEEELLLDSWLVGPVESALIFTVPLAERWKHAAKAIGVDLDRLVPRSGKA